MALSGLDIYKLLPKTNCRDCGFVTCLAFSMQLAKKAVAIEKCPHISDAAKKVLEASSQPPIKLVTVGAGEQALSVGNETVLFRHEEKFHHPCGIGFILDDSMPEAALKEKVAQINSFTYERVGQKLSVDLIAVKQVKGGEAFLSAVRAVDAGTRLGVVLMSADAKLLAQALGILKGKKPLLFPGDVAGTAEIAGLAKEYGCGLVVSGKDLESVSGKTRELAAAVPELVIDTGAKPLAQKLWDLTQARRLALKKSDRSVGYPMLVELSETDPYLEVSEAVTCIAKYAGIVLVRAAEPWAALAMLTARQNIYTDPQKPLQIEPKVYAVGQATEKSPLLVTTNFSLSYYTVLGEVEASKVPAHIMTVDTEGQSVLTAWASEKFNGETVSKAMEKFGVKDTVSHRQIIIPGYVAVMSGDLEEQSGWKVLVGPKEAAGLPQFLKNL